MVSQSYHYPDLTSCWRDINIRLWRDGLGTIKMNCDLVPPPLILEIDSCVWDENISWSQIGYSHNKLNLLKRNYFDEEAWKSFYPIDNGVKYNRDRTYLFKKKPRGQNCLHFISYHQVTKTFTVVWRTTELGQRFAADLMWLSQLLFGEKLILIIPYSYQSTFNFIGISQMVGIKKGELGLSSPDRKKLWEQGMRYYPKDLSEEKFSSWMPTKLVQKALLNWRRENGLQ